MQRIIIIGEEMGSMKKTDIKIFDGLSCPLPITNYKHILMAHGSGGKLTQQIIQKMFLSQFQNKYLEILHDGAIVSLNGARIAFTTDSYVVHPLFFPGGDVGSLAVHGTVND